VADSIIFMKENYFSQTFFIIIISMICEKTSCSIGCFVHYYELYDHHGKIMSYNVIKKMRRNLPPQNLTHRFIVLVVCTLVDKTHIKVVCTDYYISLVSQSANE
jgi:hypothetical protein